MNYELLNTNESEDTGPDSLEDLVKALAEARRDLEVSKVVAETHKTTLEQGAAFKELQIQNDRVRADQGKASLLLVQVKQAALQQYELIGEKQMRGCTAGEYKTLEYDEAEAIAWAIEHKHKKLLNLNKTAFKKAAGGLELEFVNEEKEIRVKVYKDLSIFLEAE
ncbi:MAG: hypothetical protein FVQ79_04185 [Planctomycetes bacterium]|nr:hypothetical protein [Planctomycetota bacterium]